MSGRNETKKAKENFGKRRREERRVGVEGMKEGRVKEARLYR